MNAAPDREMKTQLTSGGTVGHPFTPSGGEWERSGFRA